MDWIEQIFGVSLDGGNGTAELVVTILVMLALATVFLSVMRARQS